MLKAAIHSHHECRIIDVQWMEVRRASYLSKTAFFRDVIAPSVEIRENKRLNEIGHIVEINRLLHDGDVDNCSVIIAKTLAQSCMRDAEIKKIDDFDEAALCDPIKYIVGELLLNATTHAKRHGHPRSKAWISARAVEANDNSAAQVEIAIVDDGCGMLRTLADQLENNTSNREAIELAMKAYKSCNYDVDFTGQETSNQGVGLYVAKDMILSAGGRLQIVSNDCMYDSKAPHRKVAFKTLDSEWGGVAIAIKVPVDNIYGSRPTVSLDKIMPATQSSTELNFS